MAFYESPRFPDDISYDATFGPEWNTSVIELNSGHEARNQNWSIQRARFNVAHAVRTQTKVNTLLDFFNSVRGKTHGFRFKNWSDFQVTGSQGILTLISGSNYQLYKRYTSGAQTYDHKIQKPVTGSVSVAGGGSYSVDSTTGIVTHNSGAAPTGWTGEIDVPVRFDTDLMQAVAVSRNVAEGLLYSWDQILLVAIRP
jgi:uncharacterized protein (TIGR02217 family)